MDKKLGYFKDLYKNHREYALLQWLYAAVAAVSLCICGLVALLNQSLGISLLIVPLVSGVAFATNLVVWSLLNTVLKTLFDSK